MRGTAIVARNDIALTNIKFPSGRVITTECKGLYIANIYTPSGTSRRKEREYFYNAELPQLLQSGHGELIIGVPSTVTGPTDTTGNFHTSRFL
jgi:exonuclease III